MKIHRPSRPHGVAHDRRLPADGADRLRRRHRAGVLGGLGPQRRRADSRTTSASSPSSSRRAPRSTGIQHYTWMAMNPKEADDRELSREVLARIPKFLDRPTVLGIGEIGLNRITRNEIDTYTEQVELALEHQQMILIHTPHLEDKLKGTRISVDVLNRFADDRRASGCMVDHAEEHTLRADPRQRLLGRVDAVSEHQGVGAARGGHDRAVRPGAHLRRRRLRLGAERADRRAPVHHGDAPPPPSGGVDSARRVRQPGAVPRPVAEVQACPGRAPAKARSA